MATYVIGDIQGCFFALEKLLLKINFSASTDTIWFTGDLVSRGPQSLETLRFIKSLGKNQQVVLGNHDLHLLAVAHDASTYPVDDSLQPILTAIDRDELIHWLLQQPLLHYDAKLNFVMVHAGLAASWNLAIAKKLAQEVAMVLQSDQRVEFFRHMYGDQPNQWNDNLRGWERLRCIVNHFTRMRFCHADGSLELKTKENISLAQTNLIPWFQLLNRSNTELNIVFGHWAALGGITHTPRVYALDTGCVWGFCLTAMRLEDGERFSVECN